MSNLVLSSGTLAPSFATGTYSYTASVANSVATGYTVTATKTDSVSSFVQYLGSTGTTAFTGDLAVGANVIRTVVTAADTTTLLTYTVTVTRAAGSALTPTFGATTSTATGFTVQISNYDASFTWAGTATVGGTVVVSGTGLVTVTGVAAGTSSTATITTTRTGYTGGSATVTATSITGNVSVTFNVNSGSGSMDVQTTNVATNLSTNTFTRAGYTFGGWSLTADGALAYANNASYPFTASATLYARWIANASRAVTYSAGSTVVTGTAPTQATVVEGLTFTIKVNTFTRTGFAFSAWLSSGSGIEAASYSAGSTFTVGASDVTLTAQWSALPNATVTFNPDDAGGIEYVQTTNVATNLLPNTFTRPGFTFGGWSLTPTPNSVRAYGNSASYPFTSSVTLYAIWNPGSRHSVTYAAGSGTGQLPTQTPVSEGASFTLSDGATLSRVGFVLSGWSDGTNNYILGASYTMSTLDVVLTANWTQAGSHSVTYNLNGGAGTAPTQVDVVEGLSFTVAAKPADRPGFTFNSWFDGTTNFAPGATYTIARFNVSLISQWTANAARTVTYLITDPAATTVATTTGTAPASADVPEGATFVVEDHTGFARPGFAFSTWSDGTANRDPGATITMGANGVTLVAVWVANPTRRITYLLDGGTGTVPTQAAVTQGLTFKVAESTGLSRSGYIFNNWTNGAVFYAAGATYTASTSNITLTAVWRAVPTRTVTYSLGGGTGTLPVQASIAEGLTFTIADDAGIKLTGSTFVSWTDGRITYAAGADYKVGNSDVTLTAVWSKLPTKPVTYSLGLGGGTVPTETPKVAGSKFTVAEDIGITRPGFTLLGWKDAVTTYAPGDTYTMGNSIVVFNAVWTAVVARTVTYLAGGASGAVPTQTAVATGGQFVVATGNGLSLAGFTFTGWSEGSKLYAANDVYNVGTQNVSLTARWVQTVVRNISYQINGGLGTPPSQTPVASGTRFVVATSFGFSKLGSSLAGWTDGFSTYLPGAQYTVGSANVTLTAVWVPAVARTVTYSLGGGTGNVPTQNPVVEGVSFKLPVANNFNIAKVGFKFGGWSNGTATYAAGSNYRMGATDVVLTAIWNK